MPIHTFFDGNGWPALMDAPALLSPLSSARIVGRPSPHEDHSSKARGRAGSSLVGRRRCRHTNITAASSLPTQHDATHQEPQAVSTTRVPCAPPPLDRPFRLTFPASSRAPRPQLAERFRDGAMPLSLERYRQRDGIIGQRVQRHRFLTCWLYFSCPRRKRF